ncbi:hypothetical protein JZU54_07370, partial [bacterium]|nr:hypothetical protein [bacterium]
MCELAKDKGANKRWLNIPVLYDIDARLRMMDEFPDQQQILTLSSPPVEFIAGPEDSPELARIANDGLAEICAKYPERFPAKPAQWGKLIPIIQWRKRFSKG